MPHQPVPVPSARCGMADKWSKPQTDTRGSPPPPPPPHPPPPPPLLPSFPQLVLYSYSKVPTSQFLLSSFIDRQCGTSAMDDDSSLPSREYSTLVLHNSDSQKYLPDQKGGFSPLWPPHAPWLNSQQETACSQPQAPEIGWLFISLFFGL